MLINPVAVEKLAHLMRRGLEVRKQRLSVGPTFPITRFTELRDQVLIATCIYHLTDKRTTAQSDSSFNSAKVLLPGVMPAAAKAGSSSGSCPLSRRCVDQRLPQSADGDPRCIFLRAGCDAFLRNRIVPDAFGWRPSFLDLPRRLWTVARENPDWSRASTCPWMAGPQLSTDHEELSAGSRSRADGSAKSSADLAHEPRGSTSKSRYRQRSTIATYSTKRPNIRRLQITCARFRSGSIRPGCCLWALATPPEPYSRTVPFTSAAFHSRTVPTRPLCEQVAFAPGLRCSRLNEIRHPKSLKIASGIDASTRSGTVPGVITWSDAESLDRS